MNRLAILGAGGHGKVVADIAQHTGWQQIDFFDDGWPGLSKVGNWPVVGDSKRLLNSLKSYDGVVVAIGNNAVRLGKTKLLQASKAPLASLVHPSAVVSSSASLGVGTVVMAGAVVNPFVKSGESAIFNTGSIVDHDCVLGDAVHICPGVSLGGEVHVGELSWVGIGSSVIQQVFVGKRVVIGAGSTVISNIPDDLRVVGSPAKDINYLGG